MFSRAGNSNFVDNFFNKMEKKASIYDELFCDNAPANLSHYPMNDIWHYKDGAIVRKFKKTITSEKKE